MAPSAYLGPEIGGLWGTSTSSNKITFDMAFPLQGLDTKGHPCFK